MNLKFRLNITTSTQTVILSYDKSDTIRSYVQVLTEFDKNKFVILYTRFEVIFCKNKYTFITLNFITKHSGWNSYKNTHFKHHVVCPPPPQPLNVRFTLRSSLADANVSLCFTINVASSNRGEILLVNASYAGRQKTCNIDDSNIYCLSKDTYKLFLWRIWNK
jgi:hypothetical protein